MRILACLLLALLGSCASRDAGWDTVSEPVILSESETKLVETEALSYWSRRDQQDELESALTRFEMVHSSKPTDYKTLIYLARGYHLLADGHYDNDALKMRAFERSTIFGEKAIALNIGFAKKISQGKSPEESLDVMTVNEVSAMYWTAASLERWSEYSGSTTIYKHKNYLNALMKRVEKLNPNYYYGAVPRYWGSFLAVATYMSGGNLEESKKQFNKSLKMAPEYLGTHLLMAERYWARSKNKEEFKKSLRAILDSSYDTHANLAIENGLEKKKAEKLLAKMGELF